MKQYSSYILIHPQTKEIVYCGISTKPKERYWSHVTKKKNPDNKGLYSWTRELISKGLKPKMIVLQSGLTSEQAQDAEMRYIKNICTRFNIQSGGLMPPSQKGKIYTQQQKKKSVDCSVLKKQVSQYSKNGELVNTFIGVREACRITKIDHRSIAQVAGGSETRKSAGGYTWKYN